MVFKSKKIRPLRWLKHGRASYQSEPVPGMIYKVYPAPNGEGFIFEIPGHAPTPSIRASIARYSCEYHWKNKLGPVYM